MPLVTLIFLALVVVALPTAYWLGRSSAPASTAPGSSEEREAVAERDAFIEQLRELAWQHRDVAPELSTIIIDEITRRHRRGLPGPGA